MSEDKGPLYIKLLDERIKPFEAAYKQLHEDVEALAYGAKQCDLKTMLNFYVKLDAIMDMCKALTTMSNVHMPELSERISKFMTNADMDAVEMFGYKFTPASKRYISVTKGNQEAVIEWLKNHSEGKELVSENYNANALTSFVNKLIDEEGYSKTTDDFNKKIPDTIGTFEKPVLTMRKLKGK